ncbi:Dual specificity phosphatase, catalytic domain [Seminavis robusta]|uniref:Dual specificity phosphatase, catalytic domain n=1 Tax=Seminavis robusta TaxID=568900 RepID=A0A9N8I0G2_9STRA|nr:Dual specificity phosphatase, catalytic domain [Seminavis robusta]|eukprot:Sro3843_g351420.1 Dual specificity phosphatase, catalytic domain (242) ;mRNA; r:1759-2484
MTTLLRALWLFPFALQLGRVASLLSFTTPERVGRLVQLRACDGQKEDLPCCPSSNFPLEFFKTPGNSDTPHNFGPASPLDTILYTAEQPGKSCRQRDDDKISAASVQEWIQFVRGQGVTNVVTLLNEDELDVYEEPGLKELLTQAGMSCYIAPMGDLGACDRVFDVVRQVEADGEKVVCHCTGGIGRAGRVAAAWLVHRYNLSPEVATLIVLDQAYKSGVKRLGHTEKLSGWIGYDYGFAT